jgi:hypothetical protein
MSVAARVDGDHFELPADAVELLRQVWTATVRLQRQPGYEAMIERMQRPERGRPVDLDELRRPRS